VSVSAASYDSLRALCRKNHPAPEEWRRALLLAGIMRWFAEFRGFGDDGLVWAAAGMARRSGVPNDALRAAGMDEETIRLVRRERVADADAQAPLTQEEQMGCLLVTLDHLSELVAATAVTRPKGSVKGLKVSAVQKKFRDSRFAPQANRMTILQGARRMRWEIGDLTSKTIKAILACEDEVREAAQEIA